MAWTRRVCLTIQNVHGGFFLGVIRGSLFLSRSLGEHASTLGRRGGSVVELIITMQGGGFKDYVYGENDAHISHRGVATLYPCVMVQLCRSTAANLRVRSTEISAHTWCDTNSQVLGQVRSQLSPSQRNTELLLKPPSVMLHGHGGSSLRCSVVVGGGKSCEDVLAPSCVAAKNRSQLSRSFLVRGREC